MAHDISAGNPKSFWFPEVDFPNNWCDNGINSSVCLIAEGMLDCLPGCQESAPMTPSPPRQPHTRAMRWADEHRSERHADSRRSPAIAS